MSTLDRPLICPILRDLPWSHELNVVLPPGYALNPERDYPVLWVTDGAYYLHFIPGLVNMMNGYGLLPELIIVTVGQPTGSTVAEWGSQRTADLFPGQPGALLDTTDKKDPAVQLAESRGIDYGAITESGHADKFLNFMIDEARPLLAKKYRMADDHGLMGHSAGGAFTAWAMFARPGDFKRYFIGSGTGAVALAMERKYAETHDDLNARVFIGAGDIEADGLFGASQRLLSNPVRLGENLVLRQYPSLELDIGLYTNKGHVSVIPLSFSDGLMFLYKDLLDQ